MNTFTKKVIMIAIGIPVAYAIATGIGYAQDQYRIKHTNLTASEQAELRANYIAGCIESGENFRNYCDCTYDYLIKNLGFSKFYTLALKYEQTKEIPEELLPAVTACISEMPKQ